jgi:phage gp16-like protein
MSQGKMTHGTRRTWTDEDCAELARTTLAALPWAKDLSPDERTRLLAVISRKSFADPRSVDSHVYVEGVIMAAVNIGVFKLERTHGQVQNQGVKRAERAITGAAAVAKAA